MVKGEFPHEPSGVFDRTHLRFFTRKSMVEMFERAGYEMVRQTGITPLRVKWIRWLLLAPIFWLLPDTRFQQFACIARPRRS